MKIPTDPFITDTARTLPRWDAEPPSLARDGWTTQTSAEDDRDGAVHDYDPLEALEMGDTDGG